MIIKYYEWLKIIPHEKHPIYELCKRDADAEDGITKIKNIDKQTAQTMIKDNHLLVVCNNKHGIIWE
jgi:hypothetical protein